MSKYRITTAEYTNAQGDYWEEFHMFPIGTLVEMDYDDGSQVPSMVAIDGPDAGHYQYVPYACMEAVVLGIKAEHVQ